MAQDNCHADDTRTHSAQDAFRLLLVQRLEDVVRRMDESVKNQHALELSINDIRMSIASHTHTQRALEELREELRQDKEIVHKRLYDLEMWKAKAAQTFFTVQAVVVAIFAVLQFLKH